MRDHPELVAIPGNARKGKKRKLEAEFATPSAGYKRKAGPAAHVAASVPAALTPALPKEPVFNDANTKMVWSVSTHVK